MAAPQFYSLDAPELFVSRFDSLHLSLLWLCSHGRSMCHGLRMMTHRGSCSSGLHRLYRAALLPTRLAHRSRGQALLLPISIHPARKGHDFSPETVDFMRIDPQRALPCNLFCAWPVIKHHFDPEIFWLQDADGAPIIAVQRRASGVAQKSGGIPGTYCADSQQPGRLSHPSDTCC